MASQFLLFTIPPISLFVVISVNSHFVAMERFTHDQRILIRKTFGQNDESAVELRMILGRKPVPTSWTVQRLMRKLETTGSVVNVKSPGRNRTQRNKQQVALVQQTVAKRQRRSIRRHSQQISIPLNSWQRMLTKYLHLHAHKIQLMRQLKPVDLRSP